MSFATHEDYFQTVPDDIRTRLERIIADAERRVPGSVRCIAYAMPALRLPGKKGRVFFYAAAFRKHIGIYPPVHEADLVELTARWRGPKGNLAFPHREDLPLDLIGRVAEALAEQYRG